MIPGKAWKDIKKLCPCIRGLYFQLADAFWEATSEELVVIETLRDVERQKHYVRIGASRTMNSKHLPQPPDMKSLAFDVCPSSYLKLKQWNPHGAHWTLLGRLAKDLGLGWGGSLWLPSFVDQPHFQLKECQCNR